jgi:hypothetical protein
MSFQLKPDEEILMQVQQHWVPFIPRLSVFTVWFVVPWFFLFPLFRQGEWGVGVFVILVGSALLFGFRSWYAWSRTMFVVTNRRMVDIDQHGFFARTTSDLFFTNIDDVSYKKKGPVQIAAGYGTVLIQTRGAADDIEVRRVKKPAKLHDLINDMREAEMNGEPTDPKERKVKKIAHDLSEEELEDVAKTTKKRFRKKALDDFFKE